MSDVAARVGEVLAEVLQIELQPGVEPTREGLEAWDSLGHLRVVMAVEEEFGVRLEADEVAAIASLGDLQRLVSAKLKAALERPAGATA